MKGRSGELRSIKDILGKFLKTGEMAKKFKRAAIGKAWEEAAGPSIAAQAFPVALKKGVLVVAVTSSVWQQELLFEKQSILDKLKNKLTREQIADIHFKVGAKAQSKKKVRREGKSGENG